MPCLPDHVEGKDTHLKHFFSTTFHFKHITVITRCLDVVADEGEKNSVEGWCRLVLKLPLLQTNHILVKTSFAWIINFSEAYATMMIIIISLKQVVGVWRNYYGFTSFDETIDSNVAIDSALAG